MSLTDNLTDKINYLKELYDYNDSEQNFLESNKVVSLAFVSLDNLKETATFLKLLGIRILPKDINVLTNPKNEIEAKINTFGSEPFKEHPRWLNCSAIDIRRYIAEQKSVATEPQLSTTTFEAVSGNLYSIKKYMKKDSFRDKIKDEFDPDFDLDSYEMRRAA